MVICSLCKNKGHNRNNRKFHTKEEVDEYNNKILVEKLVGNIFKKNIKAHSKMEFTNDINEILSKNKCKLIDGEVYDSKNNHIGDWDGDNILDEDGEVIGDINRLFKRTNCDNKPSEYIEALCHIIPNMKTKDDIPKVKPNNLVISDKNFETYLKNIEKDKRNYKNLIKNKYENIKKYNFNKEIEYIYIPGKFNDEDITPQEIKDLINETDNDIKQNKSDYYIKFKNENTPYGCSVKDNCKATKTNYSVETCIKGMDTDLSKSLNKLRKDICKENGVTNGKENDPNSARNDEKRSILNKTFKRNDLYHTTINTFIIWNTDYVKNYIIDNMYSIKVNYPIYECINGKISNINKNNIIESNLEAYPEAEFKQNGEERDIAKLFYKLTINFSDNTKKEYRIETRIKGSWWSGSIQFQSHLI